jgi:acyl-CoA thioester hydrolase
MARIELTLPPQFTFSTSITVRIDDVNYGNHLSNHIYLAYMHQARMQFLASMKFTEFDIGGAGVIMGDVGIVFKKECFYDEVLNIEVGIGDIGTKSFELYYRFTRKSDNCVVCEAKTAMICYDYQQRKSVEVPLVFKNKAIQ